MSLRPTASPAPPIFFLDEPPAAADGGTRLVGEELAHAKVLRLQPGDACGGLDGHGGRWQLRVRRVLGGRVELLAQGEPEREPAPGEAGAALPYIEVAVAWPRKNRARAMLGSLVQLGCAALTPLAASHRSAEPSPDLREARWAKLAREAMKQSRRTWLPDLHAPLTPEALASERPGAALAILDPGSGMSFDTWLRSVRASPLGVGNRERPVILTIGPEGGFTQSERAAFTEGGANSVWLGPHVLRIETAACAAMALAACHLGAPARPSRDGPGG